LNSKKRESEGDLREKAINVLKSHKRRIDEGTIKIVIDRLRERKEESLRRKEEFLKRKKSGKIKLNFTKDEVEQLEKKGKKKLVLRKLTKREMREIRDQNRKKQALLKELGVTEQELNEWRCEQGAQGGREAAYDNLTDYELCQDLVGSFAHKSLRRTKTSDLGSIKDRYNTIVLGLVTLPAIAEEFMRDRTGLMQFLSACFKRWRKINKPDSLFRMRLITHQHLGGPRVVAQYLENIGAVSRCMTAEHTESLRGKIKQYRHRDRKDS